MNGNLLDEVDNRRQVENIENKNVSYDEIKSLLHEKLNTSK